MILITYQHPHKDNQQNGYRNQFERWKIELAMAVQVVANHVSRTPEQFPYRTENRPIAQPPNIQEIKNCLPPRVALPRPGLPALRADASRVMLATVRASSMRGIHLD